MISTTVIHLIKEHIAMLVGMLPTVELLYRRATYQKEYLEAGLSVAKMHQFNNFIWTGLKTLCVKAQNATFRQYTDIFNTFKLSFFKLKRLM